MILRYWQSIMSSSPQNHSKLMLFFLVFVVFARVTDGCIATASDEMDIPDVYKCDRGWKLASETMRCFTVPDETVATRTAAIDKCTDIGGKLASIHSNAENDVIQSFFDDLMNKKRVAWIGLTNPTATTSVKGVWEWTDGSPFEYTNWLKTATETEPTAMGDQCGTMETVTFQWKDSFCDYIEDVNVVCQKDAVLVENGNTCDVGWEYLATTKSCYKAGEDALDHMEARFNCLAMDAYLVSINTEEENNFIASVFDPPTVQWIGLYKTNEKLFHREDKTYFDPTNMMVYHPFANELIEMTDICFVMLLPTANNAWDDVDCDDANLKHSYVCEYSAPTLSTTN